MEGALLLFLLATAAVLAAAELTVQPQAPVHEARVGASAELPCVYQLSGAGKPARVTVQWFMMDNSGKRTRLAYQQLQEDEQSSVVDPMPRWAGRVSVQPNSSLVLRQLGVGDPGTFVCQVSAGPQGSREVVTQLRVYKHPELTITPSSTPIGVLHDPGKVATCVSAHAFPAAHVQWLKDGSLLMENLSKNNDLYMIVHEEKDSKGLFTVTSDLYFRPSRSDVKAKYQCWAQNQSSDAVSITLLYPSERLSLTVSPAGPIAEGDKVTLICSADGNPQPEFTFSRLVASLNEDDDDEVEDDEEEEDWEVLNHSMEPSWVLPAVTRDDSGHYRCTGEDIDFPETTPRPATVLLHIHYLDVLHVSPEGGSITVLGGEATVLGCSTLASGPVDYSWWRGSQRQSEGPELHLRNVQESHSGDYTCRASLRPVPSLTRSASIRVSIEDKPRIVAPVRVNLVDEILPVTLSCEAYGPPTPRLTWNIPTMAKEEALPGGAVRSSVRVIVSAELRDGAVACIATNAHGEREHRFYFSTAELTPMAVTQAPPEEASMLLPLSMAVLVLLLLGLAVLGAICWYRRRRSVSRDLNRKEQSGQSSQPGRDKEKKPLQDRSPVV